MHSIELGLPKKLVTFQFEEEDGQVLPIIKTINGESVDKMLIGDYYNYERLLIKAVNEGEHINVPLPEESFYKDITD